jgi:subtilase family serine protease
MQKNALVHVAGLATLILLLAGASSLLVAKLRAQQVTGRIASEIDNGTRTVIIGTRPPLARHANDIGRVTPETPLRAMSIVFNRSSAQQADLDALIAAQQNPASSLYHQWLTPDEFAVRFGMADSDIAKVEAWLREQDFSIDGVSRSHDRITFSGTAGQVQAAFGTELHYYNVNGKTHFAPSSDLSVPAALASVVRDVTNLSTFRPKPRFRKPRPNFTSSQSGHTFLTPKDVATIYDINPAYAAGYTGKGQSIAVVGQTSVSVTDIENFQNAAGLAVKDPTLVLVPNSGNVAEFQGDESESDLDLEYSGGIAPGASIYFVYVGDNANFSVFDSIQYAIDNDIAPIISDSYGLCETQITPTQYSSLNATLAQGAAQGQSIIVPAGDNGSPDCAGTSGLSTAQQEALAVDFPASSQYVTAMGGTEFPSADVCNSSTCSSPPPAFWQPASGTDVVGSALSYIPEQVWNDDAPPSNGNAAVLSSGGGGQSALTARPSWQSSLPGLGISGTMRLVPDIALSGSPNNAGYLYCSSDPSLGITGSCSNGFRDVNTVNLTVAGGTSFDAPIFAGLVAVINQKENSVGQGVVSSTLYQLAANSTTYASAFHDITSGNNNCSVAGSTVCAGSSLTQYPAGTGYDLASGLGSIDFNKLLAAWPAGSAHTASTTTLSPATSAPIIGVGDTITVDVAPGSGSGTPTGTVSLWVSSTPPTAPLATTLNLTNGSGTYNFVSTVGGSHVIRAVYSGDSTYAASTATLALGNQSFRLTATSPTILAGSTGASTVTITPQEGYTGSISWSISSSPALTNGCYSLPNATVSSSSAVTATVTINTNSKVCGGAAMLHAIDRPGSAVVAAVHAQPTSPLHRAPFGLAIGGLMFAGVLVCGPRKLRGGAGMLLLIALTIALPGCGGGSSNTNNNNNNGSNVAPGTYTLTVVGTDTSSSTISGSTTVTVAVN